MSEQAYRPSPVPFDGGRDPARPEMVRVLEKDLRAKLGYTAYHVWDILRVLRDEVDNCHVTVNGICRAKGFTELTAAAAKEGLKRLYAAGLIEHLGWEWRRARIGPVGHPDTRTVCRKVFVRRVYGDMVRNIHGTWVKVPKACAEWVREANGWGGKRPGAGRPPKAPKSHVRLKRSAPKSTELLEETVVLVRGYEKPGDFSKYAIFLRPKSNNSSAPTDSLNRNPLVTSMGSISSPKGEDRLAGDSARQSDLEIPEPRETCGDVGSTPTTAASGHTTFAPKGLCVRSDLKIRELGTPMSARSAAPHVHGSEIARLAALERENPGATAARLISMFPDPRHAISARARIPRGLQPDGVLPPRPKVKSAMIPRPPLLDPNATSRELAQALADAYRGAMESRYKERCWSFTSGGPRSWKLFGFLVGAARKMLELGIAPATWAGWSIAVWEDYCKTDKVKRPPVTWVFQKVRMEKHHAWFAEEELRYTGARRVVHGPIFKKLIHDWARMDAMSCDPECDWRRLVARIFPGDSYERRVRAAQRESDKIQRQLQDQIDAGVFVW